MPRRRKARAVSGVPTRQETFKGNPIAANDAELRITSKELQAEWERVLRFPPGDLDPEKCRRRAAIVQRVMVENMDKFWKGEEKK